MASETQPIEDNAEAIEAWDGPLFERFVRFRHIVTTGLGNHGHRGMERLAPQRGERILDIGCGFGDTTLDLAARVAPGGEAVGVDAAPRFIESAREDAAEAGVANARFLVADPQVEAVGDGFDAAYARFGTMFFASPVAALRNVRRALVPGGRVAFVVWRRRQDNEWLYRGQTVVEGILERPEEYDEPTCGPGPFSMADADTTSTVMQSAGFADVALERCDIPILIGRDVEEAVDFVMSIGPAGELLRLWGERMAHRHDEVRAALRDGFADMVRDDGVYGGASTWIVTARAPG